MGAYGNYGTGTRENSLPRQTSVSSADLIRIVGDGMSRNITAQNLASSLQQLFSTEGATRGVRSTSLSGGVLVTDDVLLVDASAANKTQVLPDCTDASVWNSSTSQGKPFTIKKDDTEASTFITISTTASQTIDGISTLVLSGASSPFATVISNGVEWKVIA